MCRLLNLEIAEAAGEYWLYDTVKGPENLLKPLMINCVGADIINMAKQGLDRQDIIKKLCSEYEIDEKSAADDLDSFLNVLDKAGYHIAFT